MLDPKKLESWIVDALPCEHLLVEGDGAHFSALIVSNEFAGLNRIKRQQRVNAILKVHLTEAGRRAVNDGMDVLGGKGIMRGPHNLLGVAYRHAPIAITVEGANLMTRALIIFGQGAVIDGNQWSALPACRHICCAQIINNRDLQGLG